MKAKTSGESVGFDVNLILGYVALTILYIVFYARTSNWMYISLISSESFQLVLLMIGLFVLLVRQAFNFEATLRRILWSAVLISVSIGIYKSTGRFEPFFIVMYGLLLSDFPIEKLIKYYAWISIIGVLGLIIGSKIGLLYNFTYLREGHIRFSLGDTYPTSFSGRITFIYLMVLYLKKERFFKVFGVPALVMSALIFRLTDARVDFVVQLSVIAVSLVFHFTKMKKMERKIAKLGMFTPSLLTVGFYMATHAYMRSKNWAYLLDQLLTNRLYWTTVALQKYDVWTPFGQNIKMIGAGGLEGFINTNSGANGYFFLDSSYANIPFLNGIIFFGLILVVYYAAVRVSLSKQDYFYPIVVVIASFHWIINQYIISPAYSPLFIVAIILVLSNKRVKNDN